METVVTAKGQIVIPSSIRRKFGIKTGTKIYIYAEESQIILQPVTAEYVQNLRGSIKGSGALKNLEEERKRERVG